MMLNLEDYTYDDNGNLLTDANKGISLIKYNHLNLPTEIIFTPTKKINYIYNASGDKLKKVVTEGPQVITTDYLDGFQYRNAVLQFFPHAEGYVVNTQTTTVNGVKVDNYNYVYNYLDHLGNVRLSYAWDYNLNVLKIIEENGYYPYGLRHSGYNGNLEAHKAVANETKVELKTIPGGGGGTVEVAQNMVRFNHREWQSELDLNVTDMDFRQYDNAIGRFVCTDPVTHFTQSPYQFGNGNPIYWADPSGLFGEGNTWIEQLWNSSGSGTTTWTNTGSSFSTGDISIDHGGASNMFDTETGIAYESLSSVTTYSSLSPRFNAGIIQSHVYWNSRYYQGFRDKQNNKSLDDFQDGLDWLGTVPLIGEPADFINAGISAARGNKLQAGLSLAAMVPVGGWLATGAKQIQKHHIIPRAVFRDANKAVQEAIDLNGGFNLKNLPTPFHGNHPQYNTYVKNQLEAIKNAGITPGSIQDLQKDLSGMINTAYDNYKATGQNLNDYFRQFN